MVFPMLLIAVWAGLVAGDSQLGDSCWGEVLLEQRASTKADLVQPFIVAYGGDPGAHISCISLDNNHTTSTLIGGGPGKRYAILSVASTEDTDVDFVVKIFGMRQLQARAKRQSAADDNIFRSTDTNLDRTASTLRLLATSMDTVRGVVQTVSDPLGLEKRGVPSLSPFKPTLQFMDTTSNQLRFVAARIDEVRKLWSGLTQVG